MSADLPLEERLAEATLWTPEQWRDLMHAAQAGAVPFAMTRQEQALARDCVEDAISGEYDYARLRDLGRLLERLGGPAFEESDEDPEGEDG